MDETKNIQTPTGSPHPPRLNNPSFPKTASLQCKIHLGSLKTFSTQIFGHDGSTGRNEGHRGVKRWKVFTFFTHISSVKVLEFEDKDASISCVFSVYKVYSVTLLEPKNRSKPCDVHLLATKFDCSSHNRFEFVVWNGSTFCVHWCTKYLFTKKMQNEQYYFVNQSHQRFPQQQY